MDALKVIARLRCDFPTKFGLPRQSGLNDALKGKIVFEPRIATRTRFGASRRIRICG